MAPDAGDSLCPGSPVSETRRDTGNAGDMRRSAHNPAVTQRRLSTRSPRTSYLTCRRSWHGSWHGAADSSSSASAISAIGRGIGAASAQNARGRTYGKEKVCASPWTAASGRRYIKRGACGAARSA